MLHNETLHLGLHCSPKYPFRGFQSLKGLIISTLFSEIAFNTAGCSHYTECITQGAICKDNTCTCSMTAFYKNAECIQSKSLLYFYLAH